MVNDPKWKYEGSHYYDMNITCPFCISEETRGCEHCNDGEITVDSNEWFAVMKPEDTLEDTWRGYERK